MSMIIYITMKQFLIILVFVSMILSSQMINAEEEIFLDVYGPEIHRYETGKLHYQNEKKKSVSDEDSYIKPSFSMIKKMFDEDMLDEKNLKNRKE